MHELAVCQSLLDQVKEIARENDAFSVTSITLRIGPLSGIEPTLLERAFEVARAGSVAETASLILQTEPVRIHCSNCGVEREVRPNCLRCPACSAPSSFITSGDGLTLSSLAIERNASSPEGSDLQGARHV